MQMILLTTVMNVGNVSGAIVPLSSRLSLEMILSILAIIISVATAIGEFIWNRAINATNLESEFYKEIYFQYLMKKIPKARQEIRFNENKIQDVESLIDTLNNVRQDSLFFKYKDKQFYIKLKDELQSLEDYLVSISNKKMDSDEFSIANTEINKKIELIYEIIMKKYKG